MARGLSPRPIFLAITQLVGEADAIHAATCLGAGTLYIIRPRLTVVSPTGANSGGAGEGGEGDEEDRRQGRC